MAEITEAQFEGLRKLVEEAEREGAAEVVLDVGRRIQELKWSYKQFESPVKFKPGDIVKWKRPLRNKRLPRYDEPAIVVQVLAEPQVDPEAEPGSTYFKEPLDIILGIIHPDGSFLTFYYDQRRFELWKPSARAKPSQGKRLPKGRS
jgi:hypothetical protein